MPISLPSILDTSLSNTIQVRPKAPTVTAQFTIPKPPIHTEVEDHFQQRQRLYDVLKNLKLRLHQDISIRTEWHQGQSQVELFSETNSYFTTYPISEQVFSMLQDILEMQPYLERATINLTNQYCIQELILKGILELYPISSSQPRTTQFTQGLSFSRSFPNSFFCRTRRAYTFEKKSLTIGELQTKTTPTCLSSLSLEEFSLEEFSNLSLDLATIVFLYHHLAIQVDKTLMELLL